MRLSLLTARDWAFLILLPLLGVGTIFGYMLSSHSDAVISFVLCALIGFWIGISFELLFERGNLNRVKRYYSQHNIWVGWTRDAYAVNLNNFDSQVAFVISRMSDVYPDAWLALSNCTVVFREPEWIQLETLRRVRGEQDGSLLVVGWSPDLAKTALLHELGHRILQVCASIPGEEEGHQELIKFGLE